jgi:hypothetical protein
MKHIMNIFLDIEIEGKIAKQSIRMKIAPPAHKFTGDDLRIYMDWTKVIEQKAKQAYIELLREMNNLNASNHEKAIP